MRDWHGPRRASSRCRRWLPGSKRSARSTVARFRPSPAMTIAATPPPASSANSASITSSPADSARRHNGEGANERTARVAGRVAPRITQTKNVGAASRTTASKSPATAAATIVPIASTQSSAAVSDSAERSRRTAMTAQARPATSSRSVPGTPRSASMATQSLLGHGLVGIGSLPAKDGSPGVVTRGYATIQFPGPTPRSGSALTSSSVFRY